MSRLSTGKDMVKNNTKFSAKGGPASGWKESELGPIPEEWEDGELFVKTISEFILQEDFLLTQDLNERTITHKLAELLQRAFQDFDVDCEYNRMISAEMGEEYITKSLRLEIEQVDTATTQGKTVYPDIIVHKRGDNDSNYLVIEFKKSINTDEVNKEFDFKKLCAYTRELKYKWGIYLEFKRNSLEKMVFFREGKRYE